MSYTHRLTICSPVALIDSANAIARSMDPDVGGDESFSNVRATDANAAEFVICDVWVREQFATQATAMLGNPAILHAGCAADYASRWPDLTAPTLAECQQFITLSAIHIEPRSDKPLADVLAPLGLTLVLASSSAL
jgi:hypothetical protein